MAIIPPGSTELTFDEALAFQRSWTDSDRELVTASLARCYRDVVYFWSGDGYFNELDDPDGADYEASLPLTLEWIGDNFRWYVPPSGGYVAGHRNKTSGHSSEYHSNGVNDIYLHAGFIRLRCDTGQPIEVELSGRQRSALLSQQRTSASYEVCDRCWLVHPPGDC